MPKFEGGAARQLQEEKETKARMLHLVESDPKNFLDLSENERILIDSLLSEIAEGKPSKKLLSELKEAEASLQTLQSQVNEDYAAPGIHEAWKENATSLERISAALTKLDMRRQESATQAYAPGKKRETPKKEPKVVISEELHADQDTAEALRKKISGEKEIEFTEEEVLYQIVPPPSEEITKEYAEAQKKFKNRLHMTLEEARGLVPHGGRIWQFVYDKVGATKGIGRIYSETAKDFTISTHNFDPTTDYVRLLAKYRRAVEVHDDALRKETLAQITNINTELGIEGNALIEQLLEEKDLKFAGFKKAEQWRKTATKEASATIKEFVSSSTIDLASAEQLLHRPSDLWELAHQHILSLGDEQVEQLMQEDAATKYVFALADYNRAARKLDVNQAIRTLGLLQRLNRALSLEGNALVQSEMERFPGTTRLKNPFET